MAHHAHGEGDATATLASYRYAADPLDPTGQSHLASHSNSEGQERHYDWQRHLLVGYTLASGQRFRRVSGIQRRRRIRRSRGTKDIS